jgi:hypothetical protein
LLKLDRPEPFLNRTFNTQPGSALKGIFNWDSPLLANLDLAQQQGRTSLLAGRGQPPASLVVS